MKKTYKITTIYANYPLYCTEQEATEKFRYFCRLQRDVTLYEVTETGCRKIAASHR